MTVPAASGDRLAIIVGSGLSAEAVAGDDAEVRTVPVRRAAPMTLLDAGDFVVLARHGHEAFTPAHAIDHHANIRALVAADVGRVLAIASVGSLRGDWPVGTLVAPDDFLALGVAPTFHEGAEGHRTPGFDAPWRRHVLACWLGSTRRDVVDGGVYAMTTGPRFETPAEIRLLADHADVVGMTVPAELILAGEAGLAYAAVCRVDNLANGVEGTALDPDELRRAAEAGARDLAADLRTVAGVLADDAP